MVDAEREARYALPEVWYQEAARGTPAEYADACRRLNVTWGDGAYMLMRRMTLAVDRLICLMENGDDPGAAPGEMDH